MANSLLSKKPWSVQAPTVAFAFVEFSQLAIGQRTGKVGTLNRQLLGTNRKTDRKIRLKKAKTTERMQNVNSWDGPIVCIDSKVGIGQPTCLASI